MSKKVKKPYWPLCADVFTFWDKCKIFKFLLTEKMWTYGTYVRSFEEQWEKLWNVKHVIMVSSGSTANELIALRRKWELEQEGNWPLKNKVIFPVNTWVSSVTPWIHAGFEPVFVDVEEFNLNVSSQILQNAFIKNENIGTVFYTSLLGFYGDIEKCKQITEINNAKFLMDNCESTYSKYINHEDIWDQYDEYLMTFTTSSTSLFYSHFCTTGTEGGLIATNSDDENEWFRMMRSHGLTRGMPEKYKNPEVNPDFDFALLGSNYRSSNLQAFMGSLDFDRAFKQIQHRKSIWSRFKDTLFSEEYDNETDKYRYLYNGDNTDHLVVPLAIPILCQTREQKIKVETFLKCKGVQTRPIIGGNLLMHTAFKKYGNPKDFRVAMKIHENGIYIGLNKDITLKMAEELAKDLAKL